MSPAASSSAPSTSTTSTPGQNGFRQLTVILLLALFHGLLYVFLVPPWQHYDEPSHFEYVWLIASRGTRPQPGDFDPAMRQDLARSMIDHGFYRGLEAYIPNLDQLPDRFVGMTYLQLAERPLYYFWAAVPVRLLQSRSITAQLYGARLASLLLYLLTAGVAWGLARELVNPGHPLRLLLPLTVVMIPGFTDLMTAVNNDAAAVAAFSLFLWGGVRLVRRGLSLPGLLWVAGAAALCAWTKSTVLIALPLGGLAVLLAVLRGRWSAVVWAGVLLAGVASLMAVFSWGGPAYWYRSTSQAAPTRLASDLAPVGDYVLQVDASAPATPRWLRPVNQPLPLALGRSLSGKTVTLGGWMWATEPVQVRMPVLNAMRQTYTQEIAVGVTPEFHAFTLTLPDQTNRIWIALEPLARAKPVDFTVFYDGLVLVEGEAPLDEAPRFDDAQGMAGTWGGARFENLLRNPSAEQAWPVVRQWADALGTRYLPDSTRPSMVLYSLLDREGAWWHYKITFQNLTRTFWARFGWGHVPLAGHKPYRVLGAVTLLGLLGFGLSLRAKNWKNLWEVLALLGLALAGLWGGALIRDKIFLFVPSYFLSAGRYTYPAILPFAVLFSYGWWQLLRYPLQRFRNSTRWIFMVYLGSFVILDAISIWSILRFYGGIPF